MSKKWTEEQEQYLIDNAATMTDREIGLKIGRGEGGVKFRRVSLGMHKGKGGNIGTGQPQPLLTRANAVKDSRYFDSHELECWITGSPR